MGQVQKMIALVPMKAHSERVPNKNLRPFCGRPLYHSIVSTLVECPLVEKICVNTDSEEIARDAGAAFPGQVDVIWRPPAIRGDFVSMNVIIGHDLSQVTGEWFLQTHSTNPLLTTATITKAIERFFAGGPYDSLFSVTRRQARFYDREGRPMNHNPEEMLRTQDLPPLYEENSNLYVFSRASFDACGRRIGRRPILFEMSKLEAIDIDDEADFAMAELLYRAQRVLA